MYFAHVLPMVVLLGPIGACAHAVALRPALPAAPCSSLVPSQGLLHDVGHRWLRPDAARDRRALDAWCQGVGPAVATTHLPTSDGRAIDRLALVSWNVHVGQGDVAALVDALRSGMLTDGRAIGDFVLMLQEARRSGPLVPDVPARDSRAARAVVAHPPATAFDIIEVAERLGLHLYYVPSMRNGRECEPRHCDDRGSALLSTIPLADLQAIELPFERQRRVTIAASVAGMASNGDRWTMRLVNAHLENRAGARRLWIRSGATRARQAKGLVRTLPEERPLVLAGDLNTWLGPFESTLRIIRRPFAGRPVYEHRQSTKARRGLDYSFSRLPVSWTVDMSSSKDWFGSDHPPIVTVVGIR